jgi:hypothetical protein
MNKDNYNINKVQPTKEDLLPKVQVSSKLLIIRTPTLIRKMLFKQLNQIDLDILRIKVTLSKKAKNTATK